MITKHELLDEKPLNYDKGSVFISMDGKYYKIDIETNLIECLSKSRIYDYDVVLNFLDKRGTYVLCGVIKIGSFFNTCYIFEDIKIAKLTKNIIMSFAYQYFDTNNILSIDEYNKYSKIYEERKSERLTTSLLEDMIFSGSALHEVMLDSVFKRAAYDQNRDKKKEDSDKYGIY